MSSSNQHNQGAKKGTGRKKLKLEKIQNEYNLGVTFSKRRHGLFKKANELTTLCGSEAAIVVFSPAGKKVYCYGHPSVNQITRRFAGEVPSTHDGNLDEDRGKAYQDQVSRLSETLAQLEHEKKIAKEKKPRLDISNMSLEALHKLHDVVVNLQQECGAYFQNKNRMKLKDHTDFEGYDSRVGTSMTGAVYREVMTIRNHPSGNSGLSPNPDPNRPAPHFIGHKRPSSQFPEPSRPTTRFAIPSSQYFEPCHPTPHFAIPSSQLSEPCRPIPHFAIPFHPMVCRSGPTGPYGADLSASMELYNESSSSDVIPYSNTNTNYDGEASCSSKAFSSN